MNAEEIKDNLVSVADAAKLLGYSRQHVLRLIDSGELRAERVGRAYLIDREELREVELLHKGKQKSVKKTKIIATVGPACDTEEKIEKMIESGVNVFRLNFSHGDHKMHGHYIRSIKKVRERLSEHVAILADLQGPKIRIGNYEGELKGGHEVTLSCGNQGPEEIPVQYMGLVKDAKVGDRLLLDDGKLELKVTKISGQKIKARVIIGGVLKPKKGINLPTGTISAKVITGKDKEDAKFALSKGVDFLALSFVKEAKDIYDLRKIVEKSNNKSAKIIAKIERHEALTDLDEIVVASDGVMVARGDLGIELLPQEVPIMQKRIIRRSLAFGKPCIVATQMLESMIENARSTRAETSDIANAILDGADATMLSGETSVGKYPLNAVKAMRAIALNTEEWMERDKVQIGRRIERDNSRTQEAVATAGVSISKDVGSKYIVAATTSGSNAKSVAKYRPHAGVVAVTQSNQVARQLALSWGVESLVMEYENNRELVDKVEKLFLKEKKLKSGDKITVVSGVTKGEIGGTNLIRIHKVE